MTLTVKYNQIMDQLSKNMDIVNGYKLSPAQRKLWMEQGNECFNTYALCELNGNYNKTQLNTIFNEVINYSTCDRFIFCCTNTSTFRQKGKRG